MVLIHSLLPFTLFTSCQDGEFLPVDGLPITFMRSYIKMSSTDDADGEMSKRITLVTIGVTDMIQSACCATEDVSKLMHDGAITRTFVNAPCKWMCLHRRKTHVLM